MFGASAESDTSPGKAIAFAIEVEADRLFGTADLRKQLGLSRARIRRLIGATH
jgi:hypothetical protein